MYKFKGVDCQGYKKVKSEEKLVGVVEHNRQM